jgi:large subunit ribosomal protein L30
VSKVKITQRKSTIGCPPDQKGTMRALGLSKIGRFVVKDDNPTLRGMLFKVKHLIEVEDNAE